MVLFRIGTASLITVSCRLKSVKMPLDALYASKLNSACQIDNRVLIGHTEFDLEKVMELGLNHSYLWAALIINYVSVTEAAPVFPTNRRQSAQTIYDSDL